MAVATIYARVEGVVIGEESCAMFAQERQIVCSFHLISDETVLSKSTLLVKDGSVGSRTAVTYSRHLFCSLAAPPQGREPARRRKGKKRI